MSTYFRPLIGRGPLSLIGDNRTEAIKRNRFSKWSQIREEKKINWTCLTSWGENKLKAFELGTTRVATD